MKGNVKEEVDVKEHVERHKNQKGSWLLLVISWRKSG